MTRLTRALPALLTLLACVPVLAQGGQTDLDEFMKAVMTRRDDNWKKLQQYVLDERQEVDIRAPGRAPLYADRREYTWYIRDGFFVRSPVRVNGVSIGEADRRRYEADFLRRERARDERARKRAAEAGSEPDPAPGSNAVPQDLDGLIRQARQPEFISSAYFLRFKFDEGQYAFVGRETFAGREVLRVEYYPTKLFADDPDRDRPSDGARGDRERRRREDPGDEKREEQVRKLLNKGSLVTLWIEPSSHQIVRYTFDNVALDFFPAQWLASVTGFHASMTMGEPFPDVWLPEHLALEGGIALAIGLFDIRLTVDYDDYRRADVSSVIRVPRER